jgi:methylthioribose-1-phosphate isomerase
MKLLKLHNILKQQGFKTILNGVCLMISRRPTAVNLEFCCDAIIKQCEREPFDFENVCEMARLLMAKEAESCDKMAEFGAALINDGDGILTHVRSRTTSA